MSNKFWADLEADQDTALAQMALHSPKCLMPLPKDFPRLLFNYLEHFKAVDEPKLVSLIKHALIALYQGQ